MDQLRAIGTVAPALLDAVIAYLDDGNAWAAERLTREPGWVLDAALTHAGDTKVFAAHLHSVSAHEIAELPLGKKTEQLYAEAEKLHRQLDRHAYGPPPVRFTEEHVDGARAARVPIEFDHGRPIIVDRSLYCELVKDAIQRTHGHLRAKATAAAAQKKTVRASDTPADPIAKAKRARDGQLRELANQAHGANLDLGAALIHGLATVAPDDMNVARFFVYALLGADYDKSPYTQTGERVARLAAGRIRLAIADLRKDLTKRRENGTRGRLRIDYGDHRNPQAAVDWLWKFIDGAHTAGELYGRAVVVIAAEQHASRLVLPGSQRIPPARLSSHKDLAAKALRKLAAPHLPASLTKLEQAVKRNHLAYQKAERAHREPQHTPSGNAAATGPSTEPAASAADAA